MLKLGRGTCSILKPLGSALPLLDDLECRYLDFRLKILNFPWIQKQMKEEDSVLSHTQMKSQ